MACSPPLLSRLLRNCTDGCCAAVFVSSGSIPTQDHSRLESEVCQLPTTFILAHGGGRHSLPGVRGYPLLSHRFRKGCLERIRTGGRKQAARQPQETFIDGRAPCQARCPLLSFGFNWRGRPLGRRRCADRFPYGLGLPHLLLLRINEVVDGFITVGAPDSGNPSRRRQS